VWQHKRVNGASQMAVTTSTIGDTRVVTIGRPPVNALDFDAILMLEDTFAKISDDVPKAGMVLTGSDAVFSAGVDTRAFARYGAAQRIELVRAITRMVARLLAIPVPVVAAVNGHALGGGFVLMLACDFRIAADVSATKLGITEAQAGIPFPAGPLEILRHELAPEMLRRLSLSSAVLGVHELFKTGILDALYASASLTSKAVEHAKGLALQPAFRTVKHQIRGGLAERLAALAASGEDPLLKAFK